MQLESEITQQDAAIPQAPIPLQDPYIDPSLHHSFKDDLIVNVLPLENDEAQSRALLDPNFPNSIFLSVRSFGQAPHFRFFMYGENDPEMIAYDSCVVCSNKMMAISCVTDRQGKQYLTLGLCCQCGFLQHIKRPPKEWYANFYRKSWDPGKKTQENWPEKVEPRTTYMNLTYGYVQPGQRVLEIGSGWGGLIYAFKLAGFECQSIEATEHRSAFIRERLGIPCFTGEAEDVPLGTDNFQPESFDLIISTHVLEHVYNTRQVLEHTYGLLRETGMALLEVPNYYQENFIQNTHDMSHTCNFSQPNFLYLLQSIGFDLVRDFSDETNILLLVRKAPPLTQEQRDSKLKWLSSFLPHRALAYLLEKNGLARLPLGLKQNVTLDVEWYLHVWGRDIRFVKHEFDFLSCFTTHLDKMKNAIVRRKPLELVSHLLPIQYVYNERGSVPIWYY